MSSASVKTAGIRYLVDFIAATALYVGAVLVRPWAIAEVPGWAVAVKLLPILPVWLMLLAVIRHYRRIDEYAKVRLLKSVALGFGIGSCLVVSYTFLTDVGLPPLAITWAWPTLAVSWAITSAIFAIHER